MEKNLPTSFNLFESTSHFFGFFRSHWRGKNSLTVADYSFTAFNLYIDGFVKRVVCVERVIHDHKDNIVL